MLGIGYVDAGFDEEDRLLLPNESLLQCPYGILYPKRRCLCTRHRIFRLGEAYVCPASAFLSA